MTTRTRSGRLTGGALLLLATAWAGCGRAPAPAAGPAAALVLDGRDVVKVTAGNVLLGVPVSGHLRPVSQVQVKSSISGRVTAIHTSRGLTVKKGELIVELDDSTHRAQSAGAAASVTAAQRDHAAAELLVKAGSAAQADLVNAKASLEAAQARLVGAQESLASTRIASPISGVVTEKLVEAGGTVVAGEKLFTVADISVLELVGMVDVSDLERIRVGQGVSLSIATFAGAVFEGTVSRIERIATSGTQQATVFVHVPGSEGRLVAGLHTRGTIRTETGAPLPIVPLTAVMDELGKRSVYVVADGRLKKSVVVLGKSNSAMGTVEVTSGLSAGESVLVSPTNEAKDGARVVVGPVETPAAGQAPGKS